MARRRSRRGRLMERFGSDRSGAVLPVFALCVTVALGTAALAVDYGRWHSERTRPHCFGATALAEALAAGQNGEAAARAQTAALDVVKAKLGDEATSTITVVAEAPGAVKVALRKQGQRTLSSVILPRDVAISVEAEASVGSAIDVCVIALEPTAGKGSEFDGEATITAHNCSRQTERSAHPLTAAPKWLGHSAGQRTPFFGRGRYNE